MAAFQSVQYLDPFAPLPPGASQAGVQAVLTGAPAGQVAYAQLLAGATPVAYGTGSTGGAVRILNPAPLAAGVPYLLQVQFATAGRNPADLDWTGSNPVLSAPVVTQQPRIATLTVGASGLTFAWEPPEGAVAGAYLQLIDLTSGSVTGFYYLGAQPAATFAATFAAGHSYGVAISAVQPISGGTAGNFAAPYTSGPPTAVQPIPTTAPTLTRAAYDEGQLAARWTAPTAPANAPAPQYELLLMDGAAILGVEAAGSGGGQLVTGELSALTAPGAAARIRYGSFVGPPSAAVAVPSLPPKLVSATVTGTPGSATITALIASPGPVPAGGSMIATLYANGVPVNTQSVSGTSGSATWSAVAASPTTVYEVDAAVAVSNGNITGLGPRSPRLPIPVAAPQQVAPSYDGQTVTIGLAFAAGAPVDGYQVVLSDGTSSRTVNAGPQLPISFPANLDLAKSWTASVTPVLGIVTAIGASGPVALPAIAPPSLTSVVYDGESLFVQWSAATLPFLDGYRVSVNGGPGPLVAADQTSCVLPLTPGQAAGAVVTVAGLSPLRSTAASNAVTVLAAPITMTGVTVGSQVVATWTSGSAPTVRAELLIGDVVQAVVPGATATGVTFAIPSAVNQPYRLRARAASADGIAVGPPSATVDLLLIAPALISGLLGGEQISLRWNPVDLAGAATFGVKATPASGSPASFAVAGTAYDGPAPAAFATPGTLTLTPANSLCTGPSASIPIAAAGSVTSAVYDGSQLSVTASVGVADATVTYWFDVLVDGVVAAREAVTVTGVQAAQNVVLPVSLSEGASASVRIAGVGPAALALSSAPAGIPTAAPVLASAAYDGTKLHVGWNPVPGPGVRGYVVSVSNASVADTYVAGAESSSAAIAATLSYPFAGNVLVTVRAAYGSPGTSPYIQGAPSLPVRPALAGYAYSTGVGSPGYPPYVYRRGTYQALSDVSGHPIVLYLPKPFTGSENPTVPSSGATAFELAPVSTSGDPPLPYQLTLGAEVWTSLGSTPVRSDLRQTYVQFLSAVEDVGTYPWAINLIRQLIAQAMPQTFEEVLYYRYGLWRSDSVRIVDLTPGTRLQLSTALYQAIVGGTSAKNGFLAAGGDMLELMEVIPQGGAGTLAAGAGSSLSVDAFLSLLYPGGGAAPGRPVAAGPLDFFENQTRLPYYRLFYPPTPFASGSNGSTALEANVTLIGAMSWKILASITDSYAQNGTFPTGTDYFATYFRGRASVTPMIAISVQGEPRWSTLGISARQALAAQGLAPYYGGDGGQQLAMHRASSNLYGYSTPGQGLALDDVDLGNAQLDGVTPLYWPLDMPLVGGDQVSLRQA